MTLLEAPRRRAGQSAVERRRVGRRQAHPDVYANNVLTPVEVQIFIRYQEKLAGRVLDVGCGAGSVLAYLLMIGAEAHGIDLAPKMVEYCRRTLPDADVRLGDAARSRTASRARSTSSWRPTT